MAHSQVDSGVTFIASSFFVDADIGTGDVLIDKPVGTLEDDLVVLFGINRNSLVALPTGGTTWIEKFGYTIASTSVSEPVTTNDNSYLWYKIAGGSEPSQYTLAYTDEGTDGMCLICATFRNASSVETYGAVDTKTAPSLTASEDDTFLSWRGTAFGEDSAASITAPTGMTLIDKHHTDVAEVGLATAYEHNLSAGATGTRLWGGGWGSDWDITGNVLIR